MKFHVQRGSALLLIQVGEPRTGTTFQFNSLCLMAMMKYPERKIFCGYEQGPNLTKRFRSLVSLGFATVVIKTHDIQSVLASSSVAVGIFRTKPMEEKLKLREKWRERKFQTWEADGNFAFIQDESELRRCGVGVVWNLQPVFDLPNAQMLEIQEHLRKWDVLRICCGKQMSNSWRQELIHPPSGISPHQCAMYNISMVEMALRETKVFKILEHHGLEQMASPSVADALLTGHYCAQYERLVREKHVDLNVGFD